MSGRKVVRKHATRPRHGRESDHVCSGLAAPAPTTAASSFKSSCGHNLAGATSSCGPPGDGKPLDLTQLSSEQRSKLESFLKSSGFGPLPKAGQTLDAATMRKLAQHMRAAAALPSKTTLRNWADTEKNPKDGLVRQAVTSSKRDDVKNLLEEGGDVDEVEPKTLSTPLMIAVRDGSKEIVQLLLDYDADVTRRDKDGRTAIMEACAAGRDDLVQLLIDHGSCVADTDNSSWNSLTHAAANGQIRCAHVVMRHLKYDKDSQDKLKELVKKEEKSPKKKDKSTTPASTSTSAPAATAKVAPPDLEDYDEADSPAESALAIAAHKGQFEFVKWYLSHKEQFKVSELEIQTACSKACYSKRLDLLRLLIEEHGAKVNPDVCPIVEIPLCAAAACGDVEMVRYLLQNGARVNDSDGSGFSPLMRACNEGHAVLVPVLLQHGASVNAQNSQYENWTPLCFAILKSNMDIVKTLVSAQANVNLGGTSPLLLAVSFNNMEIVEYLLAHGSNPTQKSLHGDSALNFAADVGNLDWVKRFHALGCDIDTVGDKGQTPLMKAAKKGALDVVEYLLEKGASVNRTSSGNDCTALSLACSKGWVKIIEFLLERGANRHAKLKDGITPLLEAVKSGNAEAADLVLYYQPKNAEFREVTARECDHLPGVAGHMKTTMAPAKDFYMGKSCKHCDGYHAPDTTLRTASENSSENEDNDEDDGEDEDEDDDSEEHIDCEDDEEEDDQDECQSAEDEEDELEEDVNNYTSDEDSVDDDDKKDVGLPEILTRDLEELDMSQTEAYDIKEGLDADIDFIRTQLAHFQPQSFEFRILNAMLRKAEQLQVGRHLPVVSTFNLMLTNLLQKSLPNHTPEELRRRFSEEISRWQHELQSNANVDDLMDKLEPDDLSLENAESGLADIAAYFHANPGVLEYPSLLMQRTNVFSELESSQSDSADGTGSASAEDAAIAKEASNSKLGLSLSPDGKYMIMTNSTSNFAAPLGEYEILRSIAAAANASCSGLANGMEHLPEELAKVMSDARRNGVFNMESFSTFFQGAKDDPQFLEDYRNAIRVPDNFIFSSNTPPASLAPAAVMAGSSADKMLNRKSSAKSADMPIKDFGQVQRLSKKRRADAVLTGEMARCEACSYCLNGGICMQSSPGERTKIPRTPEPSPDDTSEEGFEGSDDVASLEVKAPIFKPEGRSAKKTVRSTRDVATSVTNSLPPAKKPALVDVDQQQESDSSTALIHAAIRGNAKMISTLCDAGAKPNHKDKKGWTALGYAVERGHKDAVKELCEHGAELDCVMDTNQAKRDSSLTIACYNGRAEIVRILLDFKASIEHRNSNDYTPLCVACLNGHHRVAQMLIQRGADINARGTKLGISPLMLAAMNGHTTIVKLLIESNADVNQCIETNRNTALTLACFQGRTECVRVLVEKGANLEWRSKNGLNAMMEAANGGFYEIGKILVDAGAEVDCAPVPSTKDTPLTIAAEKGHAKFVQLLIDNGAAVNVRNKKGCSPLWLACQSGHFDCVRALVACGTADVDARDNRQMSCILTAFKRGHENIVRTLVDHIRCYPSEDEMTRYCREIKVNGNNTYLLAVYERCKKAILDAKHKKEAEADAKARSLLEELDMQQKTKEGQRAKKRDKKKLKKKTGKNEDDDSSVTGVSNAQTYDSEPPSPVPSRSASEVRAAESSRHVQEEEGKDLPATPADPDEEFEDDQGKDDASKKRKKRKNRGKNKAVPEVNTAPAAPAEGVKSLPAVAPSVSPADVAKSPIALASGVSVNKNMPSDNGAAPAKKSSSSNGPVVKKVEQPIKSPTGNRRPATAPSQSASLQAEDEEIGDENEWLNPSPPGLEEWVQQRSKSQKSASTGQALPSAGHGDLAKNGPRQVLTNNLRQDGWKEVVGRSKRFKVPTSAIARIIGKAGTNINAIRASTCAHIEIEKNKPGINDRLITVKGTSEAVAEAYHIIQTLCDNPDRDLEELLRETKRDSVAITNATVSTPSVVPVLIKPVPMPLEIESRRPKAPPPVSHSTQVFTNSHMHRGNGNANAPAPAPPPPTTPENYSSVVSASQQKRSSLQSTSSKESASDAARISSATMVGGERREAASPASVSSASNRGSPGSVGMPTRNAILSPSTEYRQQQQQQQQPPAPSAIRPPAVEPSGQAAMKPKVMAPPPAKPLHVESPKAVLSQVPPPAPPPSNQSTPSKAGGGVSGPDRTGIFGTLYNDLLTERHNWSPDPDLDFFAKDLVTQPSQAGSSIGYQTRESRLMRNTFEAPSFDNPNPSQQQQQQQQMLLPPFGGFSANRPASLPHDLRSTRTGNDVADNKQNYAVHNGFISPAYPSSSSTSNGMESYGSSSYAPGTYGALANGDGGGGIKYRHVSPAEPEPMWNNNGSFSGYGEFPKTEMDAERFMSVAQTLAQFEREYSYPGPGQYLSPTPPHTRRILQDYDDSGHGLAYVEPRHMNFDEPVPSVNRGSRLMKPPHDAGSSFNMGNGIYNGGSSSLNTYGWDSSLFSAFGTVSMSSTAADAANFGAITDPLPNLSAARTGPHVNGGSKESMKTSPLQSSADRRNY